MSVPEIPGFFFDVSRKRYFKITNGDQRLNSTYSNNTVRAIERRNNDDNRQPGKRNKIEDKSSQISLSVDKIRDSENFSDWWLRKRLGGGAKTPGLANRFPLSSSAFRLIDWPAWPFTDGKIFLAKKSTLELYDVLDDVHIHFTKQVASHSFLLGMPTLEGNCKQIQGVFSQGEWVCCRYENFITILRWQQDSISKDFRVVDFTDHWTSGVAFQGGAQGNTNLLADILSCRVFPLFESSNLVLYLDAGHKIVVSLEPFRVCSVKLRAFQEDIRPQNNSIFTHALRNVCYNTGKYLVICSIGSKPRKWKFDSPVYSYFVDTYNQNFIKVCRFFIITSKGVIIRDVSTKLFDQIVSDMMIPCRNDNQARPITYKRGLQILIEELKGTFKVIDVKQLVASYAKFSLIIPSPRDTMPRVMEAGSVLYVSTSRGTFLLQHTS